VLVAYRLTRRERQIVGKLAVGLSDKDIAADLGMSVDTLRTHIRNARRSARAATREQLVAIVLRRAGS